VANNGNNIWIINFVHLPPVSTTQMMHLVLWISPWIFEKNWKALMVYSGAWGKLIHEKTRSRKSRDSVLLNLKTLTHFSSEEKEALRIWSDYTTFLLFPPTLFYDTQFSCFYNFCHRTQYF
jgi:hypothetical protein